MNIQQEWARRRGPIVFALFVVAVAAGSVYLVAEGGSDDDPAESVSGSVGTPPGQPELDPAQATPQGERGDRGSGGQREREKGNGDPSGTRSKRHQGESGAAGQSDAGDGKQAQGSDGSASGYDPDLAGEPTGASEEQLGDSAAGLEAADEAPPGPGPDPPAGVDAAGVPID